MCASEADAEDIKHCNDYQTKLYFSFSRFVLEFGRRGRQKTQETREAKKMKRKEDNDQEPTLTLD